MSTETTSVVLNRAADLIEERGWMTGHYTADAGVCLETALSLAQGRGAGREAWVVANLCPAGQVLREYLGLPDWNWPSGRSLWMWNDRRESAAEVIAALRAAAVIAASRETAASEACEPETASA